MSDPIDVGTIIRAAQEWINELPEDDHRGRCERWLGVAAGLYRHSHEARTLAYREAARMEGSTRDVEAQVGVDRQTVSTYRQILDRELVKGQGGS